MKSLFLAFAVFFLPAFLFADAPTIGATTATVLTGTTASIAGTVSGDGANVTVTVNYGTTDTYGSTANVVLTATDGLAGLTAS